MKVTRSTKPRSLPDIELYNSEDLLSSTFGVRQVHGWRGYRRGRLADPIYSLRLKANSGFRRLVRDARKMPILRVHIASVEVEARRAELYRVIDLLKKTRHTVSFSIATLGSRGKFSNINCALSGVDLSKIDWLIVVDDDIAVPPEFMDRFLLACEKGNLRIAQPAHCFRSYTTWEITQRVWNSLIHKTHFVECGPLTAFHSSTFSSLLPFPETRWAWGLDVLWSEIARREDFDIGIVDATPIRHLRPVAGTYSQESAVVEADVLIKSAGTRRSNREILKTTSVLAALD